MFAVIRTGGKQYRVAQDDVIVVEKLMGDAGDKLEVGEVLMLGDGADVKLGADVGKAKVMGEVVEQTRAPKVLIVKKKRRNTYKRKKGHKQHQTVVRITGILN